MKTLLEEAFASLYDARNKGKHALLGKVCVGDAALSDNLSCGQCRPFFSMGCDHETFRFHCDAPVDVYDIEKFMNGFAQIKGERCDAMLLGEGKLALLDMYCGMSDYLDQHFNDGKLVSGKKAKVRSQIEATIRLLYSCPEVASFIDGMKERVGIFGYRAKDEEHFQNVPKQVAQSVSKFLGFQRSIAKRRLAAPMSHGFVYVMHSFPERYIWDK